MPITWEQVETPKDFEKYCQEHLVASLGRDLHLHSDKTGDCIPARSGEPRNRSCVDIKGTYRGRRFVADAKYYTSGSYINNDNIEKLKLDKEAYEADVGFFFVYGAQISGVNKTLLEGLNIYVIEVRNDEGNALHWIEEFKAKF